MRIQFEIDVCIEIYINNTNGYINICYNHHSFFLFLFKPVNISNKSMYKINFDRKI